MLDIDSAIGFVVNRTAYMMRRAARAEFDRHGHDITPEEGVVLARLWQRDGRRPAELADTTIRDRTTITRLLDRLEDKGLVRRELDEEDRRSFRVRLTEAGRRFEQRLMPVVQHLLRIMTEDLSEDDVRVTVETLRTIQERLIDYTEENAR